METLWQDIRFALRSLRRTPTFPLAAIGTLALGIAATTAIFSTVNAAILRPLPYPAADDLYSLHTTMLDGRVTSGLLSPVEILRLRGPSLPIVRVAGLNPQDVTLLKDDGTPMRVQVYGVTEGFFDLFGLPMALGAGFTSQSFMPNAPPGVIISYQTWQTMFGGQPDVVGKVMHFGQFTPPIVAVAAKNFDTPHGASFWVNFPLDPNGVNHNFDSFMRLTPGTNVERAREQMAAVMGGLARDFPLSDGARAYVVRPLVDSIVGDLRPILIVVLSATGLLLVLACVNVANLLLARGAARGREMAVRVALGAGRGRIVRQLLTESILLAGAGGIVGVGAAYGGVRLLLALGGSKLPRLETVPFDARVLLFALATLVVSGIIIGFAPAVRLAATDVKTLMNETGRAASGGRATARWLSALTIAEIALAVALVAGAGWLVRSFERLWETDPGFVADGRLIADVSLQGRRYNGRDLLTAASHDLLTRVRGVSGVVSAGVTSDLPLSGLQDNSLYVQVQGDIFDPAHPLSCRQRIASPGFFDAMGIKLLAGRDFTTDDQATSGPVAVVNRAFVQQYLRGRDPMRTRFAAGYPTIDPSQAPTTIIGVVDDVRQKSLTMSGDPAYYTVADQTPFRRLWVIIHARPANLQAVQQSVRESIRAFDPAIAVEFRTVTDVVASTLQRQQVGMTLMLMFGIAAVLLAAVGIYGVIAYAATERRNEVATRLALGATPSNVFFLVLRQGRLLAGVGAIIGLALAYVAGRAVSSRLYAVQASDPVILGLAGGLVLGIALLATMIPAIRAARLDPARVLRPE
jgi:predicted permease